PAAADSWASSSPKTSPLTAPANAAGTPRPAATRATFHGDPPGRASQCAPSSWRIRSVSASPKTTTRGSDPAGLGMLAAAATRDARSGQLVDADASTVSHLAVYRWNA